MPILIIPEELRPGMAQILRLSDSDFKEVTHALAGAPLAFLRPFIFASRQFQ
jgi:hypothetical protein